MNQLFKHAAKDLPASLVVFLVALPLCLGIALASGAPLFSGILAGIAGGLITGIISGSQLSVTGPAAGLTTIVAAAILSAGSFQVFLVAVVLAGVLQVFFGMLKAGSIGNYFPSSVIKGMLAAIGIILILKQIPHAVGYDRDVEGDEQFLQADGKNTFTELFDLANNLTPGCVIITLVCAALMLLWDRKFIKETALSLIPGPLLAVLAGTLLDYAFNASGGSLKLSQEHLVNLPQTGGFAGLAGQFMLPDFAAGLTNANVWFYALTIAIVASLESLLSIEAVDKLDPDKRITPLNRELLAQGAGNIVSGLIGGLPVTAVIVRSSANLVAGARTKLSAIMHGVLLLIAVSFFPDLLNHIPLSALATILILTGYKLAKPSLFKEVFARGRDSFVPFMVTIVAILFSDLLKGIMVGMFVGMIYVFRNNIKMAILITRDRNHFMVKFIKDVTFFNKAYLRNFFIEVPSGAVVVIDMTRPVFVDDDIVELLREFEIAARSRHINLKIIKDSSHHNFNESHAAETPETIQTYN